MSRLLAAVCSTMLVAACASGGAVHTPRPFPVPGGGSGRTPPADAPAPGTGTGTPAPAPSTPAAPGSPASTSGNRGSVDGYALSSTALSLRGAPYRNGGDDPAGFDCSGFVRYVYLQHGIDMPRLVQDQFRVGKQIDANQLEPGDLVFFSTVANGASHVGIMIGGNQFIHAPSERGVVRVEQLSAPYWLNRFIGAKRVDPLSP